MPVDASDAALFQSSKPVSRVDPADAALFPSSNRKNAVNTTKPQQPSSGFHMPDLLGGAKALGNKIKSGIDSVGQSLGYEETHPTEAVNAILGPLTRGISGAILGANKFAEDQNGSFPQMIKDVGGSTLQAITHPGAQTALDRNVLKLMGPLGRPIQQAKLIGDYGVSLENDPALKANFDNPNWFDPAGLQAGSVIVPQVLKAIGSLSTEEGMDAALEQIETLPAYFVKELDVLYWGAKAMQVTGKLAASTLYKLAGADRANGIMTAMDRFHGINRDLLPHEAAKVRGLSAMHRNEVRTGQKIADNLVEKHKDVLSQLNQISGPGSRAGRRRFLLSNPQTAEIVHELDKVSWVEGTQEVRDLMLRHHYSPPADVANLPPGNTLHHWDENYFPTQSVVAKGEELPEPFYGKSKISKSNAAWYNKRGGDGEATDDVVEQVRQRIAAGYRNASKARYHRAVLNATREGVKPGVAMVDQDLTNKEMKTGNIFTPYNEARQSAIVQDIKAGNKPGLAFPEVQKNSGLNRDVELTNPKEFDVLPEPTKQEIKRLMAAKDKAAKDLIAAQENAIREKTLASQNALKQQKSVYEAAAKATQREMEAAQHNYNLLAKSDVKLAKGITSLEGGGKEIETGTKRVPTMGHAVLPGTPKSEGMAKIEKKFQEANAWTRQLSPEHRQAIKQAKKAVDDASKEMKIRKKEIYAANPRKPGEKFSESVKDSLAESEKSFQEAKDAYKKTIESIKSAVHQSKATPELDALLEQAKSAVTRELEEVKSESQWLTEKHRIERSDFIKNAKKQKLSDEDKKLGLEKIVRNQKQEVLSLKEKLVLLKKRQNDIASRIKIHKESLSPQQQAELIKNAKTKIRRIKTFNKSNVPDTFTKPAWGKETQRVMSRSGEKVRASIDPLFKSALKNEKVAGKESQYVAREALNNHAMKTVDRFLKSKDTEVGFAARRLARAEGKYTSTVAVKDAVKRINDLIDAELDKTGKLSIPKSVNDLLYERQKPSGPFGGHPVFEHIADVFRDATFAIPYVHGWNIVTQTMAHGMGKAIHRGFQYAKELASGKPSAELQQGLDELHQLGQAAEYGGHGDTLYQRVPKIGPLLKKLSDRGQEILNNIDHGVKIAVAEELKRQGLSGPELGAKLEDIYGNADSSFLTQSLRKWGALYAGWRASTLPKTMYKASQTRPGQKAIRAMNWAQGFATQESEYGPNRRQGARPTEVNLFPALTEAEELPLFPYGTAKYLSSGAIDGAFSALSTFSPKKKLSDVVSDFAQGATPDYPVLKILSDMAARDPGATVEDLLNALGPRLTPETTQWPEDVGKKLSKYKRTHMGGTLGQKLKYYPQSYPGVEAIP